MPRLSISKIYLILDGNSGNLNQLRFLRNQHFKSKLGSQAKSSNVFGQITLNKKMY